MIVDGIEFKFELEERIKRILSSSLLKNWNYESEIRVWGNFL